MTSRISVIVCTFNRCNSLAETLESLNAMEVPSNIDWDVLVVDNNSTDQTRECVGAAAQKSRVNVRYLLERKQGLSHARNLGIASTDRDYIAFTDDDVLVARGWLKTTVETLETYQADCVGGKIVPRWLENRPPWLADNLLNVLAMLDYGEALFEFQCGKDHRILYGANFAFRRESLIRMGMFNVKLGKTGEFGGGEDKEMFEKLQLLGGKAIYNPNSVVFHKVFPDRLNKAYFRKWHYAAGRDRASVKKDSRFTIFGIESHLFRDFSRAAFALLRSVVRGRWDQLFSDELKCILYLSVFKHKVLRQ